MFGRIVKGTKRMISKIETIFVHDSNLFCLTHFLKIINKQSHQWRVVIVLEGTNKIM